LHDTPLRDLQKMLLREKEKEKEGYWH